jgi:P27 family predicted phage terminase small subunit
MEKPPGFRLPTKIKTLKGTLDPSRTNYNEPEPELKIPLAPAHLDEEGKKEYTRISFELLKLGIIGEIDLGSLTAYCETYSQWVKLSLQFQEEGYQFTVQNRNGTIQNPLFKQLYVLRDQIRRFTVEFGMTPASRARVNGKKYALEKKKSDNPFSKVVNA